MEDHPFGRVLGQRRRWVHVHGLRVLDRAVVARSLQLGRVVEVAGEHGLAQPIRVRLLIRLELDLGALAQLGQLLVHVSRALHAADLDEVVEAPLRAVAALGPCAEHVQDRRVVAAGPVEGDARVVRVHRLVLGPVEHGVADREHSAHGQHLLGHAVPTGGDEGLGHLRVERELGHLPAELGQLAAVVERAERVELLERADERLRGRRVHEVEMQQVVDAEALEQQHHVAQVGALDLGDHVVLQLVEEGPLGVEPEALARRDAAGASGALVRLRARARRYDQRLDAGAWVVRVHLDEARVDDVDDVVDGDRGLGDVGGQHHLAHARRRVSEDQRLLL
mmetsp:Transcript_38971/g.96648  ORF Transcript_38971/g.96648 Transcript_38971/m.96648 type:complete len:337 (+) Transcript_38971:295-1305(+)